MSLALLNPLALWGLLALALPVLVHLARREEHQPTDFAALRWLRAQLKPRQRIRLEERLLLALRLLLVAALVLLLARPVLHGAAGDAPWLVVVPGADVSAAPALPEDAQRRWLAPGFPPLEGPTPAPFHPSASLLRELDASLPAGTPLTVLVTAAFDGADGARPQLARAVDWRVVAGEPAAVKRAAAPAFTLAIRHAPDREPALRYLRAAAAAWQSSASAANADPAGRDEAPASTGADGEPALAPAATDIALTDAAFSEDTRHLAWLAPGPLPPALLAWIEDGGRVLIETDAEWPLPDPGQVSWRDADGSALARSAALGQGLVVQLQRPLAPEALPALLESDFSERLRALLATPPAAPTRALAATYAPQPGGASFPETPRDLASWLLWLLLALFALERWVASGRREGPR